MCILLYFYKECCTLFRHAVRLLSIIFILSRLVFTCFIRAGPEQSWILGLISAGCYWGIYIMSYMLQGLSILEDENMNYSQLWMSTRIIWLYKSRDKWSVLKEILRYFFDNFLPLHFLCSLSSGTLVNQILKFWEWLFNFFLYCLFYFPSFDISALYSARFLQLNFPKQHLGFWTLWSLGF